MITPQIEPVTEMARNHKELLKKVASGPVILANRSRKTAVVLSINDFETLVADQAELKRLQRIVKADQARSEPVKSFTTPEQLLSVG